MIREIPEGSGDGSGAMKGQRKVYFEQSGRPVNCAIYQRDRLGAGDKLNGPSIIEEWSSTTIVLPGQELEVDLYGNLKIYTTYK